MKRLRVAAKQPSDDGCQDDDEPRCVVSCADLAAVLEENKRMLEALEGLWSLADKGSPQDEIIAAAIAPKPKRSRR